MPILPKRDLNHRSRSAGYELDDQTLSPIDSVALTPMRHPKDPQNGQVLDPSWTLHSHRSYAAFEDPFDITASVKNGSDLQWFRPRPIDDQVRVDRKESHIFVGQVPATVTGTRGSSKKSYFFADGGFNAVRNCEAGLFFDVTPDLDEIERSLRRKNKAHAHLGSAFQIRQVRIQLIFRDSFAAVELLDA